MTHRRVTAAGVAGLGGTLLVVAAHVGVLVATGSRPASVLLWLVVVVVGVLAPGVAWSVRACRPVPSPWSRTCPGALPPACWWPSPGGWRTAAARGRPGRWSGGCWWWQFSCCLRGPVGGCSPRRPRGGGRSALLLTAAQLVALAWMSSTALAGLRPRPAPAGTTYIPDMLFQQAMTGELAPR